MSELSPGKKIKSLRTKAGITQKQLAKLLSKSESAIRMWELDKNEPDINSLKALSGIFECAIDELLINQINFGQSSLSATIPFFEQYTLTTSDKEKVDFLTLPHNLDRGSNEYIAISQTDSSMSPLIMQNDKVIIRKQDTCFNSQIAAVIIGNSPAVLRKILFQGSGIILQPLNPEYSACFYDGSSIEKLPIAFVGIAVSLSRDFIV